MTRQTDRAILGEYFAEFKASDHLLLHQEDDTVLRPGELLDELNSANSTSDIFDDIPQPGLMSEINPQVDIKELLDIHRTYACYEQLKGGIEMKSANELQPGDYIAVKTKTSRLWWNYMIVVEVINNVIYAVCLCAPGQGPEKVDFVSDYSTSLQRLLDPFRSSPQQLTVWEVPLHWSDVHSMFRYDHLSCKDSIEEARKELGSFHSWKLSEKLPEKLKFQFLQFINDKKLDIDEKLSLKDLLDIKQSYQWWTKSGDGTMIKHSSELCAGDHIAVKLKRSCSSFLNPWWNHMIVTDIDNTIDTVYVICLCNPDKDPEKVRFESDCISLKHLQEYFYKDSRRPDLMIWEVPLSWNLIRKVVRFDYDNARFSPIEVVTRARKAICDDKWKLHTSEHFAREVKMSESVDHLRKKFDQGIALTCEVGMGATALIVKKLHCAMKLVLLVLKSIIKLAFRSGPRSISHLSNIAKLARALQYFGVGIGIVVDIIMCAISIYLKYQRFKKNEVSKNEFYKYATQKGLELATNVIFSLLSVPCLFIPIPFVGLIVSFLVSFIGICVGKFISWAIGKLWDKFCGPEEH